MEANGGMIFEIIKAWLFVGVVVSHLWLSLRPIFVNSLLRKCLLPLDPPTRTLAIVFVAILNVAMWPLLVLTMLAPDREYR